ncbi:MAG: FKBP-type peptidyl-prolyl cis-trans isomerase [Chlamydiales bacterium]
MKKSFLWLFCLFASTWSHAEIDHDQISETMGYLLVRHLVQPGFQCNLDRFIQGIQNARAGKEPPMSEEEYEQAISSIQETIFLQTAENNLAQADAFLKQNKMEKGVEEIDPQLQFRIVKKGSGEEVSCDSTPLIHYQGSLIDGTIFAHSDNPTPLPIKQSIPGFTKGLVGMKEGEKRILYIHPELGYGISGNLPPNSLLIFEFEVLKANANACEEMIQK